MPAEFALRTAIAGEGKLGPIPSRSSSNALAVTTHFRRSKGECVNMLRKSGDTSIDLA
jgi:hypothetical protein